MSSQIILAWACLNYNFKAFVIQIIVEKFECYLEIYNVAAPTHNFLEFLFLILFTKWNKAESVEKISSCMIVCYLKIIY